MAEALTNGDTSHKPIEVAFSLPRAPHTNMHLQIIDNGLNLLVFLTTTNTESECATALGSFVYAMPNRNSPTEPLSTPLFTHGRTFDFTTRLAKVLVRRTKKPVYVGNSASFASAGMGGTVEEEMEGFKKVVEVIMSMMGK